MNIADMIVYLRQQLLTLRGENDRQGVAELLATFKTLTRAAYESKDKELVALLVDLTDSTRDLYMGKPLNGHLPSEDRIRQIADVALASRQSKNLPPLEGHLGLEDEDTQPIDLSEIDITSPADEERVVTQIKPEVLERLKQASRRDWTDHTVIRDGTPRQMRAYTTAYDELALFLRLRRHNPMWVGTFPIGLDVEGSDIDIICNPSNLRSFITDVRAAYAFKDGFRMTWKAIEQVPTIIVHFACNGFQVELFAQPRPVREQDAFIHMIVEARLLAIGGEQARRIIKDLKAGGLKTEPAFAACFQIEADNPYQALMDLAQLSDELLLERIGDRVH